MSKVYLQNPTNAPVKNWYDGSERWSLDCGEIKAFPSSVAEKLRDIFGFLVVVSPEDAAANLEKLESQRPTKVKASPDGGLEPKTDEEVAAEEAKLEEQRDKARELKEQVDGAEDAAPAKVSYSELKRGELISEVQKRGIELKGFGKRNITKAELIGLLEQDDQTK